MTTSAQPTQPLDAKTIAELNDLLQLDHDALASYDLAMREVKSAAYRETIRRYRRDHERHVADLTALVTTYGGKPIEIPHPSGLDKLGLQAAGEVGGGDPHTLVAFRNNERQSRDKYERAAAGGQALPADVREYLRTAAEDEQRHYDWVDTTLQSLGITDDRPVGVAARALETVHSRFHDAAEAVERQGMWAFEAGRRAVAGVRGAKVGEAVNGRTLQSAAIAFGAGVLAGVVGRALLVRGRPAAAGQAEDAAQAQ